jgi:hypothetical protein
VSGDGLSAGAATSVPLDGLALATASDGTLALLNESAGLVLDRLREGGGIPGAAVALATRYGIGRRRAAADAEAAARELRRLGLWRALPATDGQAQAEVDEPAPPSAWCFEETLTPIERPVRVRVASPRLAKLAAVMLGGAGERSREPPVATVSAFRRRGHEIWVDGRRVLAGADLMLARSELVRHLLLASGANRRWLAVLHAAAVSDGGGAVILAGASGSGKSTLAGRLVASGLALVTDDYAPLEAGTRELWPTPFGLSAKSGSWGLLGPLLPGLAACPTVSTRGRAQRYLSPPRRERSPRRPVALVFPAYAPGRACRLERLRPREAAALTAHAGGWFESTPERLRELADWLVATPSFALTYGDGEKAAAAVRHLFPTHRETTSRRWRRGGIVAVMTRADPFGPCATSSTRGWPGARDPGARRRGRDPRQPWPRLARLSGVHLLTPAVGAALEELGLAGSIPPDLSDYFAAMRSAGEERNGDLRADLFRIVAILNEAGVEPILLKGALRLVDGLFPDDSWRFMHDLDLLVPAAAVGRATRALRRLRWREEPPHDDATVGGGRHALVLGRPDGSSRLELHDEPLEAGWRRLLDAAGLLARARRRELAGVAFLEPPRGPDRPPRAARAAPARAPSDRGAS